MPDYRSSALHTEHLRGAITTRPPYSWTRRRLHKCRWRSLLLLLTTTLSQRRFRAAQSHTMPPPHPLRRISTGSLSSLARSQDRQHASAAGLDFLQIPLTDLSDEATTLAANLGKLNELHDALGTFNESFAAYLYALKMNAFCVEWPNVRLSPSIGRRTG